MRCSPGRSGSAWASRAPSSSTGTLSGLLDWYAIWRDDDGRRRDRDDARERHRRWHEEPAYRAVLPLARAQRQIPPAHFARRSPFLAEPAWAATNNGAERTARRFRHGQAPHFALRTRAAIDDAVKTRAFLHQEELVDTPGQRAARSRRGRPRRAQVTAAAAA